MSREGPNNIQPSGAAREGSGCGEESHWMRGRGCRRVEGGKKREEVKWREDEAGGEKSEQNGRKGEVATLLHP